MVDNYIVSAGWCFCDEREREREWACRSPIELISNSSRKSKAIASTRRKSDAIRRRKKYSGMFNKKLVGQNLRQWRERRKKYHAIILKSKSIFSKNLICITHISLFSPLLSLERCSKTIAANYFLFLFDLPIWKSSSQALGMYPAPSIISAAPSFPSVVFLTFCHFDMSRCAPGIIISDLSVIMIELLYIFVNSSI